MLRLAPREFQVFECSTDSERCNLCEGLWGRFVSVCVCVGACVGSLLRVVYMD